jgi:hypothetical protein
VGLNFTLKTAHRTLKTLLSPEQRSELIRQRMESRFPNQTQLSHDHSTPASPLGHAAGYRIASKIVQNYRSFYTPF